MVTGKWHKRFYELALHVAQWSKDPNTKVGACIVNADRQVISIGFNGLPRGIFDFQSRYANKETKYLYVVHAERNALDNAFCNVDGAIMYTTLFPCNECAKGIIQKGIKTVVTPKPDETRTHNHYAVTLQMFKEAEMNVLFVDIYTDQEGV
jgi:dCMP deaminase